MFLYFILSDFGNYIFVVLKKESKKITSLKSQIDLYKKQVQELHENLLTQELKLKKYEYENKRYEERLNCVNQDKERLLNELSETKEELQILNELSSNGITKSGEIKVNCSDANEKTHDLNMFSELELMSLSIELK